MGSHDDKHQRDLSKGGSVENGGFVRAGNPKRKTFDNGSGNFKNNYRRKDLPMNEEQVNGDVNNGGGDRPLRNGLKFNRSKPNNIDHYRNNGGINGKEETKSRFRQNYECGFRFAV